MKQPENLLIVADSEHDANMFYVTGLFVPDPFIYLRIRGRSYIVMSDLEIDRARKQAPTCRVLSLGDAQKKLRKAGIEKPTFAHVVRSILRQMKLGSVTVPQNFPLGLATELGELGIRVKPGKGGIFPQREQKTSAEAKKVSDALRIAEIGMAAGIRTLKSSNVEQGRRLIYRNAPLTSERLRSVIDTAITQAGGLASHTIVAGGKQGCDPHESGYGPLRADEPIILDIFPRSQKTGYFGDITRTVVRGRASEAVRRLYHTVFEGQELAFTKMRASARTADIHKAVQEFFESQGYKTGKRNGRMQGFFHGTGHGLGLEIHEAPRVGVNSPGELKPGHVVTVEPGLYYPELGGVRLEDVALVTNAAPRNLTRFEKILEI